MEIKEQIKNYIILGSFLIIGILLMVKSCGKTVTKTEYQPEVEHHYDTIYQKDTLIQFKTKYNTKPVYVYLDTTHIRATNVCDSIREYSDTLKNLQLDIYTKNSVLGILKSSNISYKLKVPIIIKDSSIVTKTVNNVIIQPNKWDLYAIGELGGSQTSFNMYPGIGLRVNRILVTSKYGILDKSINIGVGVKIFSSKK